MLDLACTLEKSPRTEQRQSNRYSLSKSVSVRAHEGGRETGIVENLSVGGCAINAPGYYAIGARVFVTIPNFQSFAGQVIWRQDGRMGVKFDTPLHAAIVDHIVGSAPTR